MVKNDEKFQSESITKFSNHSFGDDSEVVESNSNGTVGDPNDDRKYKTRVIYNSKVDKAMVEVSLACKGTRFKPLIDKIVVKSRVFASKTKSSCVISEIEKCVENTVSNPVVSISENINNTVLSQKHCIVEDSAGERQVGSPRRRVSINTASASSVGRVNN